MGEAKHVNIQAENDGAGHEKSDSKLARKGTGFVHVGELPPSDDEDDEEAKHVNIQAENDGASHEKSDSKLARKGTGFVHVGELPPSDDEDDDEEAKKVTVQESNDG